MELKIKDLVELLQVSEKTIYRWLKENKIPAYRINHQFRFSKAEINEWLLQNKITVSEKILALKLTALPVNLAEMVSRGGIYYDTAGDTKSEAIRHALNTIGLPPDADREKILYYILQREDLMSTAIGHGIAIPHPRTPILTDPGHAQISICLLRNEIDFKALDTLPVHTLFIVLSANPKRHLEILSKISFLCQNDRFRELLKSKRPAEEIIAFIRQTEEALAKKAAE